MCRRKGQENNLLLCDDCNNAFHMYCLRPALFEVPCGDWYCPACRVIKIVPQNLIFLRLWCVKFCVFCFKPMEQRRKAREVDYGDSDSQETEADEKIVKESVSFSFLSLLPSTTPPHPHPFLPPLLYHHIKFGIKYFSRFS